MRIVAHVGWLAVLLALVGGCAEDPDHFPTGDVDEGLAEQLEDLDLTLYLPDLRGSTVEDTRYDDEFPGATTDFTGLDDPVVTDTWSLNQYAAPAEVEESVCNAVDDDNTSSGCNDTWAYDDYEGSTTVYVVRDGTLLVASIETEDDAVLTGQTADALLEAPEIDPEDIARG